MEYLLNSVQQSLDDGKCPVCQEMDEAEKAFFLWFGIEYYYAPPLLDQVSNGGFCCEHGKKLTIYGTLLSGMYDHVVKTRLALLERYLAEIDKLLDSIWGRFRFGRWYFFRRLKRMVICDTPCPICQERRNAGELGVRTLQRFLSDPGKRAKYFATPSLCWDHLYDTIATCRDMDIVVFLLETHIEQLTEWEEDFAEYFRKLDYRFAAEPKGEEQYVWLKTLRFFVNPGKSTDSCRPGMAELKSAGDYGI